MSIAILVTGGAGYIGAHTCKALARAGYQPVTLDNLTGGHRDFVRWGPLVVGDVRDQSSVADACRAHQVMAVIHFAGLAYVGESTTDPLKYYDNNVSGTISLLGALRTIGVDKIIFSSTCAVYGNPDRCPIDEATPLRPISPYGASKAFIERIIADCAQAHSLRYIALRYFNAAGADPDGELGELREPEPHLIPRALLSAQGYVKDLCVLGSDFPTSDGTAIRDYIHVSDVADAHVHALQRLLSGGGNGTFNLGTGRGYSVSEGLRCVERVTGRRLSVAYSDRRPGDAAMLIADAGRSREELGVEILRSDLENVVRSAWRWHLKAYPRRNLALPQL